MIHGKKFTSKLNSAKYLKDPTEDTTMKISVDAECSTDICCL